MGFEQFPYIFKEILEKNTNERILQITQKKDGSIYKLNTSREDTIKKLTSSKRFAHQKGGDFVLGGGIVGLIVGIFVCFTKGDAINAEIHFSASIGSAFAFWFMFGIIGAFLGITIWTLVAISEICSNKNIDKQIAFANRYTESKIAIEKQSCDNEIKKVREEAKAQYEVYLNGFNAEAQKMSVNYAESMLALEVIEWMTSGYIKAIEEADRRSHIEKINIPFVFKTYRNKIECNLGVFDFEIKRCDELETPLEQTALARAMASAIQLNITMKYPQDISGTNVVTDISYEYYGDYVSATIAYMTINGNYKKTQSWAEK